MRSHAALCLSALLAVFGAKAASVPDAENGVAGDNCTYTSGLPEDFKCRALGLPKPTLTADFRLSVSLFDPLVVGNVDGGLRRWVNFNTSNDAPADGNYFSATWANASLVGGGQDNQLVLPNGATQLDTRYLIKTADEEPAYLTLATYGWRTGTPDVLARLFNTATASAVSPFEYQFLLYIYMETGDVRYNWTNTAMWIGSGTRRGNAVIYDAYRIGS